LLSRGGRRQEMRDLESDFLGGGGIADGSGQRQGQYSESSLHMSSPDEDGFYEHRLGSVADSLTCYCYFQAL
jgi:hypothetical protein